MSAKLNIKTQDELDTVKAQTTLLHLWQRLDKNKEFPVMGNSISQILQITNEKGPMDKLADVILRDQSLSSKILSLVNSSYYGQFGGEIDTVSRAIVILGVEQIQSLSLSILVYENLSDGPMADTLKGIACQSFLSAFFAKKLVEQTRIIKPEEAFLASMFQQFGKKITVYFLTEEYKQIRSLCEQKSIDEQIATKEILGLSYINIGEYIAVEWKLPNNIILGMHPLPETITQKPEDAKEYLPQIASLTNDIITAASDIDHDRAEQRLKDLIAFYQVTFALDYEKLIPMLEALKQILIVYCDVLGIKVEQNTFCKNFIAFVNHACKEPLAED